jgi:branched-subunit amino acid transport protein
VGGALVRACYCPSSPVSYSSHLLSVIHCRCGHPLILGRLLSLGTSIVAATLHHCRPPVSIIVAWPLTCVVVNSKGGRGDGVTWQLASVKMTAHALLTQQVLVAMVVGACACAKVHVSG